jgi:hypothetical protein
VRRQKINKWMTTQFSVKAALMARNEDHFQQFAMFEEMNKPPPVRKDPAVGRYNGVQNMAPLMRSYKTKVDGLFAMLDWDIWKSTGDAWLQALPPPSLSSDSLGPQDAEGNYLDGVQELAAGLYEAWGDAYDRLLISLIDPNGFTREYAYPRYLSKLQLIVFHQLIRGHPCTRTTHIHRSV